MKNLLLPTLSATLLAVSASSAVLAQAPTNPSSSHKSNATEYAPGQKDFEGGQPGASEYAPGQQKKSGENATQYAPGQKSKPDASSSGSSAGTSGADNGK